jgi:hypothetical protein
MALEGTFKDFHIADIVQLIGLQRKTGTLTLEGEGDTLTVIFQDGAVAWAQSTRVPWEQRIARLLVARGLLTPDQLQEALTLQRETKKPLNAILAGKGFLQKDAWDGVLAPEIEEALFRPFRWTAGRYRFVSQPSVDLTEGTIGPLSAEKLLLEGIRRVDEWPMIREKIPSSAMVFKVSSRADTLSPKQIEPNEVRMLDLVDGKRTVQDLVDASGLGEFEAMRGLALLVGAGAITSVGPVPAAAEAPVARGMLPRAVRTPAGLPAWLPRVAWGAALAWLVVCLVFFGWEPSGLVPLSAPRIVSLDRVRSIRAQADLAQLALDLEMYVATTGEPPASLEALGPRGRRLYDPWGHPYQVRRPGAGTDAGAGAGLRVVSAGPDGRLGTPDDLGVEDR